MATSNYEHVIKLLKDRDIFFQMIFKKLFFSLSQQQKKQEYISILFK